MSCVKEFKVETFIVLPVPVLRVKSFLLTCCCQSYMSWNSVSIMRLDKEIQYSDVGILLVVICALKNVKACHRLKQSDAT